MVAGSDHLPVFGDAQMLTKLKESWENFWLPIHEETQEIEITQKKAQLELAKDKKYEIRWVWYHTILAIELALSNILLLWIAINTL